MENKYNFLIAIAVIIIISFVAYFCILKKNQEKDDLKVVTNETFLGEINKKDLVLFTNEEYNVFENFVCGFDDLCHYFSIETMSNDIINIDNETIQAKKVGDAVIVLKIYKEEKELISTSFKVKVIEPSIEFDIKCVDLDVSKFKLEVGINQTYESGEFTDNLKNITYAKGITKGKNIYEVDLKTNYKYEAKFKYIVKSEISQKEFSKNFTIEQNFEKYFNFETSINNCLYKTDSIIDLYLINSDNYNNQYYNKFNITNFQKFLGDKKYKIMINNGDSVNIDAENFQITATKLGITEIFAYYNDIFIGRFKVNVKELAIVNAYSSSNNYLVYQYEKVNVSPIVVEPNCVIYDVEYLYDKTFDESNFTIINDNFIGKLCGEYIINVKVNNFIYSIKINVQEKLSKIEIIDGNTNLIMANNEALNEVSISISGNTLSLVIKINDEVYNDYEGEFYVKCISLNADKFNVLKGTHGAFFIKFDECGDYVINFICGDEESTSVILNVKYSK